MNAPQLTIFYDGLCPLCSREIDMFRRRVTDGTLGYVDISLPEFDAKSYGLDAVAVHHSMHVKRQSGEIITGVDALIAMWQSVPGFRWLAWLTRMGWMRPFANLGYVIFAWIRPTLPKRSRSVCDTGSCPTP